MRTETDTLQRLSISQGAMIKELTMHVGRMARTIDAWAAQRV
jgi:hypothetical protein